MDIGSGAVTVMTADDCWARLTATSLGRIAVSAAGQIDIFPVNYVVDEHHTLLFRTAPGTKLLELAINDRVAFEVDDHDADAAWSIVVKGRAERVEKQGEIDRAEQLGLAPWIPTLKYRWVRIHADEITGRQFDRQPEPERF
ncbi:nitroimidazol reductase NimA-like FMN-containing flavoprotein (pyridoxamine 5'-phosphate oxidase superfamily) [Microcella putealis]|uniref:Nitroimidazol reductase NimA-like FMN-containing flavoprotein (Pyridoxamine 5'-phosphate oxidase superfamily) n=1 Tax=Microcella putealis TaxID=337005 RepID=A0A4Q7LUI3_9MICO|nr:pyridoxamine 5'-phosphate oxidase family protein [Microcella putealis]RZS57618.1 nitroimidazol reductase NimA-like FMN-containing flavoprotein (pyridoxamine 5'-phosphate oxidase superfamily) [Microcella putealis]TQM24685.1 nitroimidazol reductase NimA-like FMN-containing flavoprotein (pyridoxamine 5'-phosphate oxidase superfamily) [Microcella putealis]